MAATLVLSGVLDGLKRADPEDCEDYYDAMDSGRVTAYENYFPLLLAYQHPERRAILLHKDAGSLCVFRWRIADNRPRLDPYLAPMPMNSSVLRRCFERANAFNGDRTARIMFVDEADADGIRAAGYRVRKRAQQYIFSPERYRDLPGKSLYTVRRHVARVEKLAELQVETFTPDHAAGCEDLLLRWRDVHRERYGNSGSAVYSRRLLGFVGQLPTRILSGEVIFIEGKLVAFALGGAIHDGLACSHERKCDNSISGLAYFQFRRFLLNMGAYELVNDGPDGDAGGLGQFKQSFRPIRMHQLYCAYQK